MTRCEIPGCILRATKARRCAFHRHGQGGTRRRVGEPPGPLRARRCAEPGCFARARHPTGYCPRHREVFSECAVCGERKPRRETLRCCLFCLQTHAAKAARRHAHKPTLRIVRGKVA